MESRPGPAADPPRLGVWCPSSDPASCATGFLQRTNSLEEKSRLVSAFKERQSSKNLLSCENSDRDGRFQRTETDFSNLFARGSPHPPALVLSSRLLIGVSFLFPEILLLLQKKSLFSLNHHETAFPTFEYNILPPSLLPRSPSFESWMRAISKTANSKDTCRDKYTVMESQNPKKSFMYENPAIPSIAFILQGWCPQQQNHPVGSCVAGPHDQVLS